MNPSLLVIARHGESLRNALYDKYNGKVFMPEEARDRLKNLANHAVPLTAEGERQARRLGNYLLREYREFDAVIHSGYLRARRTAEIIAGRLIFPEGEKIFADPRLRERDAGPAFYMTEKEAYKNYPLLEHYWQTEGWFYARPPDGESLADLYDGRVHQVLKDISDSFQGRRIVIVCHGRTQQVARLLLDKIEINPAKRPFSPLGNCATVIWDYASNGQNAKGRIWRLPE